MRTMVKRVITAGAVIAAAAGGTFVAAPSASAAPGDLVYIAAYAVSPQTASGTQNNAIEVKAPAPCDPLATRHKLFVADYVATDAAQQAEADKWKTQNLYSPIAVGLPGPLTVFSSTTLQQKADLLSAQIVPGTMTLSLVCQNNLGNTVYNTFSGSLTINSATSWTGYLPSLPATSTTVAVSPNPATTGQNVTLTANVTKGDPSQVAPLTGSVEFFDGALSLGTSAIDASGQATLAKAFAAGSRSITAKYLGDSGYSGSTSAAVTLTVNAAPAADTTATLSASPLAGAAYQTVSFSGTVANTSSPAVIPVGACDFYDGSQKVGSAPVSATGACTFAAATFGAGAHTFSMKFVPADASVFKSATSADVAATFDAPTATPDEQSIVVTVPAGNLSIFTPYTPANPLNLGDMVLAANGSSYSASAPFDKVTVTDTRAGNPGWAASLLRADFVGANPADKIDAKYSGFVGVAPSYISGNAVQSINVTDVPANDPAYVAAPAQFAQALPGHGTGSVDIKGNFVLKDVPTSTKPGLYTTTVTFTVG
ncbi:Ig-like domain-containing protein [Monashia sp. NPDC004114]